MSSVVQLTGNGSVPRRTAITAPAVTNEVPATVRFRFLLIDRLALRRSMVVQSLAAWSLGGELTAAGSARELETEAQGAGHPADLVIVSIGGARLDDPGVADDLAWLAAHWPDVPVVVLADRDDAASVRAAFEAGVRGYLPTSTDPAVARSALALVLAGGAYAPPSALLGVGKTEDAPRPASAPTRAGMGKRCEALGWLTPRQREVLELLGQGRPNKVIAQRLAMCESTVKVHVRQIMRKLGASNRTEVALKLRELLATA